MTFFSILHLPRDELRQFLATLKRESVQQFHPSSFGDNGEALMGPGTR